MLAFVEHRYPALWPWIQLMRLDRPIGSMLLMWPTLWALWIAGNGTPSLKHIVIFVLGVFVMRAAGCVINDFADRDFDGDAEHGGDGVDHRAAEVGIGRRTGDLVVDVVGARPQSAASASSRAVRAVRTRPQNTSSTRFRAAARLQRICDMRRLQRAEIPSTAEGGPRLQLRPSVASYRCQSTHCCTQSD